MGVVAGDATDARVRAVEAPAVCQAVRLEAHSEFAAPVIPDRRLPRSMTLAAKVRDIFGRLFSEIRGSGVENTVERIAQVRGGASVTVLAGDSGPQRVICHLAIRNRVAGMTPEADFGFRQFDLASDGLFKILGFQILVPSREIETRNGGVKAHRALIAVTIVIEHPGLRALAEVPANGYRDSTRAVAYVVGAFVSVRFDGIGVWALANRELRVFLEDRIRTRKRERPSHGSARLRFRSGLVARHTCSFGLALRNGP